MDIIARMIYLAALIAVAVVYTVVMPPESLGVLSLMKYLVPATGIGLLFVLAKGVLGEGMTSHIAALLLVVGSMAFVSIFLSSTGLVVDIKNIAGIVGNVSSVANGSLPLNFTLP